MTDKLQAVGATDRTPIEVLLQVGEDERVSSRDVFEFLGMNPANYARWCRANIEENQFAEISVDFIPSSLMMNGGQTTDYRLSIPFAKKLCMLSRTERGEQAREYFIRVEDRLKAVAQNLPQLTPNELILRMAEANVEMERRLNARVEVVEQIALESAVKLENSLKVFAKPGSDWKDSMELAIRELAADDGFALIRFKGKLYTELEISTSCDLSSRQSRLRNRLKKQGATHRERKAITKLDVISQDKQLKAVFEGIVKKYQSVHARNGTGA